MTTPERKPPAFQIAYAMTDAVFEAAVIRLHPSTTDAQMIQIRKAFHARRDCWRRLERVWLDATLRGHWDNRG